MIGQPASCCYIDGIALREEGMSEPRTKATHPNDAPNRATTLPKDAKARKRFPLATGLFDYFPDALVAVAEVSFIGNEQHNPGQPLHWAREKSTDQDDTTLRHFIERGTRDEDGMRHTAKAAWRILAMLQLEIEAEQEAEQDAAIELGG
jgi:hypothetical protein